jgi:nitric oxide reductase NorQ protein
MEIQFNSINGKDFTETSYLRAIANRALLYLRAGYAVNLRGPAGVGKTCLALYIGKLLGRPVELVFGNEDSVHVDLIGGNLGMDRKVVYDNYIHSVVKVQESYRHKLVEGKLLDACRNGKTLIYDEFTRTRPEINNILLPVLEERLINLPLTGKSMEVHKEFRMLFTSNPEEYTGVYGTQDALNSRMVTVELGYPDSETELAIVAQHSGLDEKVCSGIVAIMQSLRNNPICTVAPTVRSSVMIGKTLKENGIDLSEGLLILEVFKDILLSGDKTKTLSQKERRDAELYLESLVKQFCEFAARD